MRTPVWVGLWGSLAVLQCLILGSWQRRFGPLDGVSCGQKRFKIIKEVFFLFLHGTRRCGGLHDESCCGILDEVSGQAGRCDDLGGSDRATQWSGSSTVEEAYLVGPSSSSVFSSVTVFTSVYLVCKHASPVAELGEDFNPSQSWATGSFVQLLNHPRICRPHSHVAWRCAIVVLRQEQFASGFASVSWYSLRAPSDRSGRGDGKCFSIAI